jgi:A/G-specific adenine glycosylase
MTQKKSGDKSPQSNSISPATARAIRNRLHGWYATNARDLPWRRTSDPYQIWVSEVMLQQTQVATVVPYFIRFIKRFPTAESLASASQQDVLRHWQGLGYYRRANHLHLAVQQVVNRFSGRVPHQESLLRELPGIGRYIAGAIRSLAFGKPAAILEANSARVLARLFAVRSPLQKPVTNRLLWSLADSLLCHKQPGLHNQALMELGALVCSAGRPRCEHCPLTGVCLAKKLGLASELPAMLRRPSAIAVRDACAIVESNGRILIVQRPLGERWGGLWEFPRVTLDNGSDAQTALRSFASNRWGLEIEVGRLVLTLRHSVTHHRIELACYESRLVTKKIKPQRGNGLRWIRASQLADFPCSAPQRKVFAFVLNR